MACETLPAHKNMSKKTSLRRSAETKLTTEDLIHPHEASNLPGYFGYTPQLKFNCGHTYGYHTDKLTNRYTRNDKLLNTRPTDGVNNTNNYDRNYFLPSEGGDRKYVEKMVPGYTGFVPQHFFKYGKTYKEGTEEAISNFKENEYRRRIGQQSLRNTVNTQPRLSMRPDFPRPDPSHPGVNVRYIAALGGNKFDEKRRFTEAPIPGYEGYVPKQEEYILGGRYGVWTGYAYTDALQSMKNHERRKTDAIDVTDLRPAISKHSHTSTWPLADTGNQQRYGSVYNKRLGMVPNYTGFVPQRRFDFGDTYGDSTRTLPVCVDTAGYSTGRYNNPGPPIERTVIPVRI